MKTGATDQDPANHFIICEDIAACFKAALADRDPRLLAAALRDTTYGKDMAQIAREAGLGRKSHNKVLSYSGNP